MLRDQVGPLGQMTSEDYCLGVVATAKSSILPQGSLGSSPSSCQVPGPWDA